MIAADMDFHRFLYALFGNTLIAETASLHWQHIRRVMGGYLQRYRAPESIWDDHRRSSTPSSPATPTPPRAWPSIMPRLAARKCAARWPTSRRSPTTRQR